MKIKNLKFTFLVLAIAFVTMSALATHSIAQEQLPQFLFKWGSEGSEDGQFGKDATGNGPSGIGIDQSRNVYVADQQNHRIQKFTSNGLFITKWGSLGTGDGEFEYPSAIAIDRFGYVYVVDCYNHRIQKFTSDGVFVSKWGSFGAGDVEFEYPRRIAIDTSNNVYITDSWNMMVKKFTSSGVFIAKWFVGQNLSGVATDNSNNVYASSDPVMAKYTSEGTFIVGGPASIASIAIDSENIVYAMNTGANEIHILTSNLDLIALWGTYGSEAGQFYHPADIAISSSGYIYVLDGWNYRVQVFSKHTTPSNAISALIALVKDMNLARGITNSLDSKLENALDAFNAENANSRVDAINKLYAFINSASAQSGNKLTVAQADQLIAEANRIISMLQ